MQNKCGQQLKSLAYNMDVRPGSGWYLSMLEQIEHSTILFASIIILVNVVFLRSIIRLIRLVITDFLVAT